MIEVTVYNYLNNALSVPVYTELPKEKPQRFVVLDKIGSTKSNQQRGFKGS